MWALPWLTKGLGLWWSAGDWAVAFHPGLAPANVSRYLLNNWGKWLSYCEPFLPQALALKKGIDRRGQDRHWTRFLPEHTWSTTGLLAVLLGQSTQSRVPDPAAAQDTAPRFLEERLHGEGAGLLLPMGREYNEAFCCPGGQAPQELCAYRRAETGP